jgi:hypothetical protein
LFIAQFLYAPELLGEGSSGARICDVHWGGANLAFVDWQRVKVLGDEVSGWESRDTNGQRKSWEQRLADYSAAERAYRQLAVELRNRGLRDESDVYSYRAYTMHREVLRRQFKYVRWVGSTLLDSVSGYGYRPLRSFGMYALVILSFAVGYWLLTPAYTPGEAVVVSMTAFHGRGFLATTFAPADAQGALAAIQAFIGLLIEIVLIATFSQRLFAR